MTKILQVSTRHNVGGISKLIIELLGDSNFEQVYATGRCENNEKEYSLQLTSPTTNTYTFHQIHRLKRSINFADDVFALLTLIKIIKQEKPDIIHTHMSKAGLLGRIAALVSLRSIRLVHSYHGHVLDGYFNKLFTQIVVNVEKILGNFTDAFVFDGGNTQFEVNNYGIRPKKIQQVILPGLIRRVSENRRIRTSESRLRILVVARIERVKRIDLILSVARSLQKDFPKLGFDVTIVGDGELRNGLEDLCQRELLPIKFIGWTDAVEKYYQETDILLSTSDSEGTPLTFMEAASYGCPIISTNVGSVSDLIEDGQTGILCTNNPIEIAREISRLWLEPGLLEKLSQNSIAKATEEFTLDKFIQKHSNLYKSLLN